MNIFTNILKRNTKPLRPPPTGGSGLSTGSAYVTPLWPTFAFFVYTPDWYQTWSLLLYPFLRYRGDLKNQTKM